MSSVGQVLCPVLGQTHGFRVPRGTGVGWAVLPWLVPGRHTSMWLQPWSSVLRQLSASPCHDNSAIDVYLLPVVQQICFGGDGMGSSMHRSIPYIIQMGQGRHVVKIWLLGLSFKGSESWAYTSLHFIFFLFLFASSCCCPLFLPHPPPTAPTWMLAAALSRDGKRVLTSTCPQAHMTGELGRGQGLGIWRCPWPCGLCW